MIMVCSCLGDCASISVPALYVEGRALFVDRRDPGGTCSTNSPAGLPVWWIQSHPHRWFSSQAMHSRGLDSC